MIHRRLLLPMILFVSAAATGQEERFANVEVTSEPVAGPIHMLTGAGGNIGVSAGPDGLLIVDTQYSPLAPKIEEALAAIDDGPLRFIVNTHFHGDHTGGNPVFGQKAPIVAHENVRERLARTPRIESQALPSVTYTDKVSLHLNGEEIRILHLPAGHTDTDSAIFWTGSKVIHMGDHFFNGMFPFIDLTAGGTVEGYAANVGRVLELAPPDAKIIPGHGPLASVADLQTFHTMLTDCIRLVKAALDEGKDLEAIRAAGLPEQYRSYGDGFISTDRWLATLFNGLGGR